MDKILGKCLTDHTTDRLNPKALKRAGDPRASQFALELVFVKFLPPRPSHL